MRLSRDKIFQACVRLGADRGLNMTWSLALDSKGRIVVVFMPADELRLDEIGATEVDAGKFRVITSDEF